MGYIVLFLSVEIDSAGLDTVVCKIYVSNRFTW